MRTTTRRRMAGIGMAALLATAGVGWRAASAPSSSAQPVHTAGTPALALWFPWLTTTTTTPRTTTTTQPPVTTTTAAPATTTTVRPPTTTVRTPVVTTPRPPVTTTTPPPPPTVPPVTGGPPSGIVSQLLSAVNARRATGTTCGGTWYPAVPPLSVQGNLTNAAQGHAQDMATNNYFSHTGLDGSDPNTRMARAGYRTNGWAENIAAGQTSVADVMASWWSSPGHCEDFMAGFVSQIGFGLAQNPSSTYGIYWVADMASPG